ncbi:triose-phosphate isomerase [Candidatus Peribacteria bacterium]|nr:MAG: triose-phosphate isomerase [Candidatus Peribacteria bacterium]
MKRTPLIAANWKMNAPPPGWDAEDSPYRNRDGVDIVVFPTFLDVHTCVEHFLVTGGQYGRAEEKGAMTGDVSMQLLANHGCTYVLCGHSERRIHHAEHDGMIAAQVQAAIQTGLHPILCIGETADEREMGQATDVIQKQLSAILQSSINLSSLTIAYEPVWAIGNGQTAQPQDIQEMHTAIRALLSEQGHENVRIIYGGSVKPENASAILSLPDVDGALVGASSLDPSAFRKILDSLPI